MEPAVHLRAAVSLLGRFPALAGVDLDVARGEIVLLQGPNGAGKSTLLRTLAGLHPVVSGTAEVLDVMGDRVRVRVNGPLTVVAEVTPAAVAQLRLGEGGPVWAFVKATEVTVYPA